MKTKRLTPWEKEWAGMEGQQTRFLTRYAQYTPSALDRMLEGKVPPKLQSTLESAFAKAFSMVFRKGTPLLERTFSPEETAKRYQEDQFSADLRNDRRSLRAFSRRAALSGAADLTLSGVEGVVLGALGVGIPDIPVFTALLLRSLYTMAGQFGFPYDTPQERYFQLLVIRASLSWGEELSRLDQTIDRWCLSPALPEPFDPEKEISLTARALSAQLLYTKFLQGIPVVGIAGGASDVVCLARVRKYAGLKYQRRMLLRQKGR